MGEDNLQKQEASLESNNIPKILRYAAIDIGSNAIRLLLCNVVYEHDEPHFKKSELIRIPLRLGEDVFNNGRVSYQKMQKFFKTMAAFKLLMEVFDPVAYRACATASLRDALNGEEMVKLVKRDYGMKIEIISGREEADLIFSNHVEERLNKNQSYLYIDVGGGSTELTLFSEGRSLVSQSFDIGTIRWLQNKVIKEKWNEFKDFVRTITHHRQPLTAIGSGGNINKIFKILGRKDSQSLSFGKIKELYSELKSHTIEERMEIWKLNPDRADVIVPAAKIFLSVMKAGEIEEIIIPQIGLVDGIVHELHEKNKLQYRVSA